MDEEEISEGEDLDESRSSRYPQTAALDQLIAQFGILADSLNRWYLLPTQQAGREIYQSMVGKLMNLPAVQTGSPSPLSSSIEQQSVRLRQQRIRLLESQPILAYAALIGKYNTSTGRWNSSQCSRYLAINSLARPAVISGNPNL